MKPTALERETIVNQNDGEDTAHIWTMQRSVISKCRKHPYATEVASGFHGGTEWAQFTAPADKYNPVTGFKRFLSEEERAARAARLKANTTKKHHEAEVNQQQTLHDGNETTQGQQRPRQGHEHRGNEHAEGVQA